MTSSIREFWAQLNGSVHPLDKPYFDKADGKHSFDLDYPPPAFIGDVDNAKVVILMASGGLNDNTKSEFPAEEDRLEYIDWLGGRRKEMPKNLSKYYIDKKIFTWIDRGQAVLVNAIAYRSPKISQEPKNEALGKSLPSYKISLDWLSREILPMADKNKILVIAHRYRLWGLQHNRLGLTPNLIFSPNPASPHLALTTVARINSWLLS
jgi:hypothetical protein